MDPQPPEQLKTLGIANIIGGAINLTFGWFIGSMVWSIGGGLCTGIATCGFCPFGSMCGVLSVFVAPLGMAELGLGVVLLTQPKLVKGLLPYLPFLQIPAVLLGDFVSPVLGLVGAVLTRQPEVAGYIEEM